MSDSGYYLDLSTFTLHRLKDLLSNSRLLPSQKILQEEMDERFSCLEQHGIENLQQLQLAIKTKAKVHAFAQKTGLPVDYLTILRREVNSYQPKPIYIRDYPGVNPEIVQKLDQISIKNSKQLFPRVLSQKNRAELAQQTLIDDDDILRLTKLADVSRLKWVGPKFAALLIASGYDTVQRVAESDYRELDLALARANDEHGIYQGKIGLEDLKMWVNVVVQTVPQVIQYG